MVTERGRGPHDRILIRTFYHLNGDRDSSVTTAVVAYVTYVCQDEGGHGTGARLWW